MSDTAVLLSRALDTAVEPPDDATSDRILDAALAVCAASGARHLTMDEVARRAGVGRMTVYRRFGERNRLMGALAAREGRRCLAQLDAAVDLDGPVEEQIADGFLASMRIAREHPLLHRLARTEPEVLLASLTADDSAIFAMARAFLAARLRDSVESGQIRPLDPDQAAELLVRLCLSFVLIQNTVLPLDDDQAARDVARSLIAPIVAGG